jgi:hypothetical protein
MNGNSPELGKSSWELYSNRILENGVILVIGKNAASGQFEVVPIDTEGAREPIRGNLKAREAYFHPTQVPGLMDERLEANLWDEALDAYNDLPIQDQAWTRQKVERIRKRGKIGPTLVLEVVKSQRPRA